MEKNITNNARQTQAIAREIAQKVVSQKPQNKAVVLALWGDLGAGKTTFTQGFAKALGIKGKVLSPTFTIMKKFTMHKAGFKYFYHMDCYRLNGKKDLDVLGFQEIVLSPENIVVIEWPEKIKSMLPKGALRIQFKHVSENIREILF